MTSFHDVATPPSTTTTADTSSEQLQARLLELEAQNDALRRDVRDLTDRADTSDARFQNSASAQLVLDARGVILGANIQVCTLLGRTVDGLLNHALSAFVTDAALTSYRHLLKGATVTTPGAPATSAELRLRSARGAEVPVGVSVAARHEDTRVVEYLVTLTDLSAYHAAHEVLLLDCDRLERQVREVTARFSAQRDEVEEIVGALSGEVHTAVHRASGFLDLLQREVGVHSDVVEQHFGYARRALEQATGKMVALVGYVRTTRTRVRLRDVNLRLVLDAARRDLDGQCAGRSVKWSSDVLPVVQGDSQALGVVLTELLTNALKFTSTREEARIRVRVQETDSEVHLGVEDNGVGFNMRSKEDLFRLFRRLHPSGTFEGSGVGLAVVRRVCERFGARVWADAKPEAGATFWVAWPKQPLVLA